MDTVSQVIQNLLNLALLVGLVGNFLKARGAEVSATAAATHALAAVESVGVVADKVEVLVETTAALVENTNGVSQRLEKLAGEAGEARGIEIGRAENKT